MVYLLKMVIFYGYDLSGFEQCNIVGLYPHYPIASH